MKTILLDTSIDYTSWDINEARSIDMTEASRVQQLLIDQNAEIDWLKNRNEKLETALRHYACGCKENKCQVRPRYRSLKCGWPARQALGDE